VLFRSFLLFCRIRTFMGIKIPYSEMIEKNKDYVNFVIRKIKKNDGY
jgi:hypothetical protein